MSTQAKQSQIQAIQVELELSIKAPITKVWGDIVSNTTKWWPKDFYTSSASKEFIIEPKLGGRMYEDAGSGTGLVWMTVHGIEPPKYIYLVGHIRPPFGGPAISMLNIRLSSEGKNETKLELSDAVFGQVSENMAKSLDDGWKYLFENCLKAFVEKQKR